VYDDMSKQPHSREHIYAPNNLAAKAADAITGFVGSWAFVGIHAIWFIVWITLRVEAFPFGLLTLLVSLEAIFLSTFVMMSQNRAAERDHIRDDHEAEEVDMLYQINQTQLEILQLLRQQLCTTDGGRDGRALQPTITAAPVAAARQPQRVPTSGVSRSPVSTKPTRRRKR
jgi:uncharacterized membrane protein